MAENNQIPKEVENFLIEFYAIIKEKIVGKTKQGGYAIQGWNGFLGWAEKQIIDFSDKGWPKEKIYEEKVKPFCEDKLKEHQPGGLLPGKSRKRNAPDEPEEEPEVSVEKPDPQLDQDERIKDEAERKYQHDYISRKNEVGVLKNRIATLKQDYDENTKDLKIKCLDVTRRQHPIICSIFRCMDSTEKAYNFIIKALDAYIEEDDSAEKTNSKAAEFYTTKVKSEIKKIEKSLMIDPEIWIEGDFKNWVINFYFLDEQIDEIINEE